MKATLRFNLSDKEDKAHHDRCVKSLDMALALWEIDKLKIPIKHHLKIVEIFEKYNVFPDTLID